MQGGDCGFAAQRHGHFSRVHIVTRSRVSLSEGTCRACFRFTRSTNYDEGHSARAQTFRRSCAVRRSRPDRCGQGVFASHGLVTSAIRIRRRSVREGGTSPPQEVQHCAPDPFQVPPSPSSSISGVALLSTKRPQQGATGPCSILLCLGLSINIALPFVISRTFRLLVSFKSVSRRRS